VDNVFSVRQMSDGGYNIFAKTHNLNGVFAWLIKTDSQGDIIWDETVEVQEIVSVLQMSDGGYVIETRLPNRQVGLMKIDSEGNKLWDMTLDDTLLDASDNVFENALDLFDETKDGGCIIAGSQTAHPAASCGACSRRL